MRLEEGLHIVISVITIALAFSVVSQNSFPVILLTVGSGFILHELAHKYVALHYRAWAEYRAWTVGLLLAVLMAVTTQLWGFPGFVFAAPGAVFIYGPHLNKKQNGHVALAGAATNVALAVGFLGVAAAIPALYEVGMLGAGVNIFLGWFNSVPFFPLDGQKVYAWNKGVWALVFVTLTALLLFFPMR